MSHVTNNSSSSPFIHFFTAEKQAEKAQSTPVSSHEESNEAPDSKIRELEAKLAEAQNQIATLVKAQAYSPHNILRKPEQRELMLSSENTLLKICPHLIDALDLDRVITLKLPQASEQSVFYIPAFPLLRLFKDLSYRFNYKMRDTEQNEVTLEKPNGGYYLQESIVYMLNKALNLDHYQSQSLKKLPHQIAEKICMDIWELADMYNSPELLEECRDYLRRTTFKDFSRFLSYGSNAFVVGSLIRNDWIAHLTETWTQEEKRESICEYLIRDLLTSHSNSPQSYSEARKFIICFFTGQKHTLSRSINRLFSFIVTLLRYGDFELIQSIFEPEIKHYSSILIQDSSDAGLFCKAFLQLTCEGHANALTQSTLQHLFQKNLNHPTFPEHILRLQGMIQLSSGQREECHETAQKILLKSPTDPWALSLILMNKVSAVNLFSLSTEEVKEIHRDFNTALKFHPSSLDLKIIQVLLLLVENNYQEALSLATQVLDFDPRKMKMKSTSHYQTIIVKLGQFHLNQGNDQALSQLINDLPERALSADEALLKLKLLNFPGNLKPVQSHASIIRLLNKVRETDQNDYDYQMLRGKVLFSRKRPQDAALCFSNACLSFSHNRLLDRIEAKLWSIRCQLSQDSNVELTNHEIHLMLENAEAEINASTGTSKVYARHLARFQMLVSYSHAIKAEAFALQRNQEMALNELEKVFQQSNATNSDPYLCEISAKIKFSFQMHEQATLEMDLAADAYSKNRLLNIKRTMLHVQRANFAGMAALTAIHIRKFLLALKRM